MAWIELHHNIRNNRKTYKLMAALKISKPQAVGMLALLWTWALESAEDGDITDFPASAIAGVVEWKKGADRLLEALIDAGWIDRDKDSGQLTIHDWDEYTWRYFDKLEQTREQTRKRVREYRERKKALQSNGDGNDDETDEPLPENGCNAPTEPNRTVPYIDDEEEDARARARLQLSQSYQDAFGRPPTPEEVNSYCQWLDKLPVDVVEEAVRRAAASNARNPTAYAFECLRNWYAAEHRTLADVQGAAADRDMAEGRV